MYLVTGAAGFIGSHIVERLLADGRSVIGLDNFHPYYPAAIKRDNLRALAGHERFRLVEGDIRDRKLVDDILANGVTAIVHMAGLAGVRPSVADPVPYMDVNVGGTAHLLDRAVHHKVRRFVHASSSSVYGNTTRVPFTEEDPAIDPVSPYGASKRAAELVTRSYSQLSDLGIANVRLFTVYGPRQRPEMAIHYFVRSILRGEEFQVFGDGSMSRDYTYVSDIVEGIVAAVDCESRLETFNLGGAHPVSLTELIDKVSKACGREPRIRRLPAPAGDVRATSANISHAGRVLGFVPRVSLDEGIERFVAWYREHGLEREKLENAR